MNRSFSDGFLRFYLSNDKSSDDELVKIRKEKEETEEEREGGKRGRFFFSHRQWSVESNHTRPISLPFKRFRSSLQYS
jgi:hypothetical protein